MKTPERHRIKAAVLVALACLLAGCARFSVTQRDESPERVIVTQVSGTAWFSSSQSVAGIKALQTDKTQSFGTSQIGQQGATNTLATLEALARIAEAVSPK